MKIITQQLAEDIPQNHALLENQVVNPQNFAELFQVLRAVQNLTVYDITKTKAHPPKSIIKVIIPSNYCIHFHIMIINYYR